MTQGKQPIRTNLPRIAWRHGFVPLAVLGLYFFSVSVFLSRLLPGYERTVNLVFAGRAARFSLLLAGVMLLVFLAGLKLAPGVKFPFRSRRERLAAADLILLLLPLAPVVQYIIKNREILSTGGAALVLIAFLIFSFLSVIAIPALFGFAGSRRTLMILGLTSAFMITDMAALSAGFRWFQTGELKIQLAVFGAIFLAARLLDRRPVGRKFLYLFVVIFFLSNTASHLASAGWEKTGPAGIDSANRLAELAGSRLPPKRPNIYLLVYDAYVVNETMLAYGIDNRSQEEYLENLGFKIYPHTYSVGEYTLPSVSRILEASTDYHGSPRRGVSGGGIVQQLLKRFGYETRGIFQSNRFFQGIGSSYDRSFPPVNTHATARLLIKAILMGEFRFDVAFARPSRERFAGYKIGVFADVPPRPRFVYMHDYLPGHSQISGKCLPDEIELYRKRLNEANDQMRRDVDTIVANDPDSIIIVAGDHGPYLTKNCIATGSDYDISEISRLDIQDRFGAFLAVRWPEEYFSEYDDIIVLQDIFPAIFGYIFRDKNFLEARIDPKTLAPAVISGAAVVDGIIQGGVNDGEPLFLPPE